MSELTRGHTRLAPAADLRKRVVGRVDRITLMSLVFGLGMAAFLAIEPTQEWLLLLLSGLVALGAEGIIRTHPQSRDFELDDVVLHIFAPTVFTIVIGLFLEDFATGYAAVPAGVLMAIPFGAILNAEYHSINHRSPLYHAAHLMLNTTAYVTAFLFFVTVYDFEISLSKTVAAVGIVSFILAIEILREETYDLGQLLVFSAVVGLLAAQTAVAIYFLPFTGGASAVFLLLGFYSITGILHHYLIDDTGLPTIAEFAAISLAGLGMIAASRSFL